MTGNKYLRDLNRLSPDVNEPWVECSIAHEPIKNKDLKEPIVLVRHRETNLIGPKGEELITITGLPAISLFTGIGGMDIGIERAGFCVLVQHEWEYDICRTLIANRPTFFRHAALIQGDIRNTPSSMILQEAGLRVGEAHLVTGGPPCQGFSYAGRRNEEDERNNLVFQFLRCVREMQPKFFVFENVQGFSTLYESRFMKEFLERAYGSYYELVYGIADAVEYQVPQYRPRFICMGTRRDLVECDGIMGSLPEPICFSEIDRERLEVATTPLFAHEYDLLRHAPGIRYFPDRPVLVPPKPVHNHRRSTVFLKFYEHLEREEPDRIVRMPTDSTR